MSYIRFSCKYLRYGICETNFSVLSFRIPSKKDADLFKRLGGKTGAGFLLHGALVWQCYRMPFWSTIWEVQKLF